jgi:hypothetical protein
MSKAVFYSVDEFDRNAICSDIMKLLLLKWARSQLNVTISNTFEKEGSNEIGL